MFTARNIRDNEWRLSRKFLDETQKKSSTLYIFSIAVLSHPGICPSVKLCPCVSNVTDVFKRNRQLIQANKKTE